MIKKIESVLDKYVRPKLSEHYGNVEVLDFTGGVLNIKLTGKCSNCPSAKFTVENIIEKEVKTYVQEVEKVVIIEGVSDSLLEFARKILNKEVEGAL